MKTKLLFVMALIVTLVAYSKTTTLVLYDQNPACPSSIINNGTKQVSASLLAGDVNGDGLVSAVDITALYNWLLNGDDSAIVNGDQDGDGIITSVDITIIYNILLGISPSDDIIEFEVNGVHFKMIKVEAGTFTMGTNQSAASSDEKPAHEVTLTNDFYIGQTEVTQELWLAVMGNNPSYFNGNGNSDSGSFHSYDFGTNLQRPVEYISWDDCQEFIAKLSQMTGKNFRLPTEAEWEYAAHGGNKSQGYTYAGSNNIYEVAWFKENCSVGNVASPNYGTHTVGTKQPNELGIYDMSGNVDEWCQDWYSNNYYRNGAQTDPTGPITGTFRVHRSGDWLYNSSYSRIVSREYNVPNYNDLVIGVRLAMTAE